MAASKKYAIFIAGEALLGILTAYANFPSMVLLEEIISKNKRAMFSCLVALFETVVFYTPLYAVFDRWDYVFYIIVVCLVVESIAVMVFLYESPRSYMEPKQREEMLMILKGIDKVNKRSAMFEKNIESEDYQNILRTLSEEKRKKKFKKDTRIR